MGRSQAWMAVVAAFSAFFVFTATACADQRAGAVYESGVDAGAAIDAALARAEARQVNALLVFGANWCHDSRGLADVLTTNPALAPYAASQFETVFIDVGTRSRNLDQLARFGVEDIFGTPTLVIASAQGATLNADSVHHWRTVYDAAPADIAAYLARFAGDPPAIRANASASLIELAAAWPSFMAAQSQLEAALSSGDLSPEQAARRAAFYQGFARSMARLALGREAKAQGLDAADSGALEALGLSAGADLTQAAAARLAEDDVDLAARANAALGPGR